MENVKGFYENHNYALLRRARKNLLDADAEAEEAKDIVDAKKRELDIARKGLRESETEKKKKALHFRTNFKEAKEMGQLEDSQ